MSHSNNLPGVLSILQINEGALSLFDIEGWNMEKALNALGESMLFKVIFPNVPAASAYFGQMWEKSLSKTAALNKFIPKTGNMLTAGIENNIPQGPLSSIGGARSR